MYSAELKKIVEEFLYFLNNHSGHIVTDTGNIYEYKRLRTAIINCLKCARDDGYKDGCAKSEAEALFDTSISQVQNDW
jgi:hypothetical protein